MAEINNPGIASLKRVLVILLVCLALDACQPPDPPERNQSTVISIPVGSGWAFLTSYALDNSGRNIFITYADVINNRTAIQKVDLLDFKEAGVAYIPGVWIYGIDNMVHTHDGHLVFQCLDPVNGGMVLFKFSENLKLEKVDTFAYAFQWNIMRFLEDRDRRLLGVASLPADSGKVACHYVQFDENLKAVRTVSDTSSDYSVLLSPTDMIQCSDGGYLTLAVNQAPPFYTADILIEKRDRDFNLEWRRIRRTSGNSVSSNAVERNGLFYLSTHGTTDEFLTTIAVLIYDQSGNLVDEKKIPSNALVEKRGNPMVATDDGGFMLSALTSSSSSIRSRKGVLYKLDQNLNVMSSKIFGGEIGTTGNAVIRLSPDRYLLMYFDNAFEPDLGNYRLVLRYMNQDGDFIN